MGMFDFLQPQSQGLGAQQPQGLGAQPQGFMDRFRQFNDQNPGALVELGVGIMNRNLAGGFAAAAPIIAQGRKQNAMAQFLVKKGIATDPEEAMALAQNPELVNLVLRGDDIISAGKGRLYNKTKGTWLSDPLMGPGGSVDYSQIPQYYKRKDGTYGIGVLGDNGTFKDVDLGGVEPLGPYGTSLDKAEGTALGKDKGEAKALLESVTAKMPGVEAVVQQLEGLADKATYTAGGQLIDSAMRQSGMEPREAAVARAEYVAMVDNQVLPLLRDTFGAQFTVQEGASLRATLGDPDKSPQEKKAVLRAFIEQKRRNIQALAAQTGQTIPEIGQTIPPPDDSGGWNDVGNGVRIRRKN